MILDEGHAAGPRRPTGFAFCWVNVSRAVWRWRGVEMKPAGGMVQAGSHCPPTTRQPAGAHAVSKHAEGKTAGDRICLTSEAGLQCLCQNMNQ